MTSYCVADNRITIDFNWLPPNITFDTEMGALSNYNVCIGVDTLQHKTSVSRGVCKQIAVSSVLQYYSNKHKSIYACYHSFFLLPLGKRMHCLWATTTVGSILAHLHSFNISATIFRMMYQSSLIKCIHVHVCALSCFNMCHSIAT